MVCVKKYFQTCGVINYVFREGMTDHGFNGTCRITYKEENGARKAVLGFHNRKFSYGHIMSVTMALDSITRKKTVRPGDWVCPSCSHQDFDCINFDWQQRCFSCSGQRPLGQVQGSGIKVEREEEEPETNIMIEENEDDDDSEEEDDEDEEEKEEYKVNELNERIPAAKETEAPWRDLEVELEDVLLNTFMNHSAFSDNLPLRINISVSRPVRGSEPKSEYLNVSLRVDDEMITRRLKENLSSNETTDSVGRVQNESTNLPIIRVNTNAAADEIRNPINIQNDETIDNDKENDAIGENNSEARKIVLSSQEDEAVVKRIETLQKGKRKFTYDEDKEIINRVMEILPGRSLQTLELPDQVLSDLSEKLSRSESSVCMRWRWKLRKWLVQYYSQNKQSWKQLTAKACQKRREDISRYFKLQAKKKGLAYHGLMMNVKEKKN